MASYRLLTQAVLITYICMCAGQLTETEIDKLPESAFILLVEVNVFDTNSARVGDVVFCRMILFTFKLPFYRRSFFNSSRRS